MLIEESEMNRKSTMIDNVVYDFANNKLKVRFKNGSVYEYENVDKSVYENLTDAESIGKYFNENIKHKYTHTQLLKD